MKLHIIVEERSTNCTVTDKGDRLIVYHISQILGPHTLVQNQVKHCYLNLTHLRLIDVGLVRTSHGVLLFYYLYPNFDQVPQLIHLPSSLFILIFTEHNPSISISFCNPQPPLTLYSTNHDHQSHLIEIMQSSITGCLAMVIDMLVGWWNKCERRAVVDSGEFLTRVIMEGVLRHKLG